jgi:hypothetical protein
MSQLQPPSFRTLTLRPVNMFRSNKKPAINVSQYTSADRQMSIPFNMDNGSDVTIPWLLNPEWSAADPDYGAKKRLTQPPKEAIKSIYNQFQSLKWEFFCPRSMEFEDASKGVPAMDRGTVEVFHFKRQCEALLVELKTLRVPEEDRDEYSKVVLMIHKAVEELDTWVEEQRVKAVAEAAAQAEKNKIAEEEEANSSSAGCIISWFVSKTLLCLMCLLTIVLDLTAYSL